VGLREVSLLADESQNTNQETEEQVEGLSWAASLGALAGLVTGVVAAMLIAAGLHSWDPESETAEVFWEIASPLLGIAGVVVGALAFHRYFRKRFLVALVLATAVVFLGLFLAFGPVGFPWREG
jgi:F0F1-type ATP synthase membrane subunit c/vacuolar-type H+-ATPase subunit K